MEEIDLEVTRLSVWAVVRRASLQYQIERFFCTIIDLTIPKNILLLLPVTPFYYGVSGMSTIDVFLSHLRAS